MIPEPEDADNPASWTGDALFQPQTRSSYRRLKWLGLTDAYMEVDGTPGGYTFWDYQAGAWQRNHGIRIDHCLLSPQAADRLAGRHHPPQCAGHGQAVRPRAGGDGADDGCGLKRGLRANRDSR